MGVTALENRADGLEESQSEAEHRDCGPRQGVCIGRVKKVGKVPRKNRHQDDVDKKYDHVKQDATVCVFKELLDHCHN